MYLLLNIVRLIITRCFWPCCMQPLLCSRTLRIRFLEFVSKNSLPSMGWIKCIITSNLTSSALESNYSTVLSTPSQQTSAFLLYIDQIKSFWRKEEPQHGKQLQKIMLGSSPFHEWFLLTSAELLISCTFWGAVETTVVLTTPLVFKEVGQQRCFTHLYQGKEVKFCLFFLF